MVTVDFLLILVVVLSLIVGALLGFGKQFKMITRGIVGFIISIVICYFIYGIVLNLPFVQNLLKDFIAMLQEKDSTFCNILLKIRIDMIVYAVVLFLVVQILRKLLMNCFSNLMEADNTVMKVVNKSLGAVLCLAIVAIVVLIALQIMWWIQGDTGSVYTFFEGSFFKLDKLYINNPLLPFVESFNIPATISEWFK